MHDNDLYRRIVDSTHDCVYVLDLEGRLVHANSAGLRQLGIDDTAAVPAQPFAALVDESAKSAAEQAIALALRGGCGHVQYVVPTVSGSAKWWEAQVTAITGADGAILQLLAVARDVTRRRREEDFRVAEHQVLEMVATGSSLSTVLDSVIHLVEDHSDGMLCSVLLLDEDGTTARHGAAPSLPRDYVRAIDGISIGPSVGSCGTAMAVGRRIIVTDTFEDPLWKDYRGLAEEFGLRACWSTPIFSPSRRVLGSFAMYYAEPRAPRDEELQLIDTAAEITRIAIEQQRAHQALRHSEARNEAMLRAIPDWMFLTTPQGVLIDCHLQDQSELRVPPSAFLGRHISEVLPPGVSEMLARAFARVITSDEAEKVEYTLGTEDTERFYEACIVRCDGDKILSIVRNITARKRAELEADAHRRTLAHLSRVSMLGELSGALAHELSQPLTAVLSNAQAARHSLDHASPDFEELRATLDDIIRNDKRAGAVIDRLRSLLRKGDTALHPVDVNDVARDVIDLAYGELKSRHVIVSTAFAPAMPVVLGDRVQLQQVVLNLVLNASDAMNGTQAGNRHLSVSTSAGPDYVELAIADRGPGIPDGQLERVFEPFVTFREHGLGLGLAISRSIVTAHGGYIRAENNPDGGATFHCVLPVASREAFKEAV